MILTIDIGNTNIHWGIFDNDNLLKESKISTRDYGELFLIKNNFDKVIISSVVPYLDKKIKKFFDNALFVSADNVPLNLKVSNPEQVGADRLVNAVAVWKLYGTPAIIIDFGTAVTFCCIKGQGDYLGGLIVPGVDLSLKSLHLNTAKLPFIKFEQPNALIGKDTNEAIQSGIYYGYIGLIANILKELEKNMPKGVSVIATGGYAESFSDCLNQYDPIIDPFLTLKGLNILKKK